MKKLLIITFLLLLQQTAGAQRNSTDPSYFIDSLINAYRGNTNTAVVVGVVTMPQGGPMETWKYTYGHLTHDTNASPRVNDSTLFQIGSITKSFTAAILSRLVNEGTISLYDTVQNFLPDSVHVPVYVNESDTSIIRFIDLATHTSGLPDQPPIGSGGMTTYEQMYNFLAGYQLTYPPGECYYYSDLGVALLGVALQHIRQQPIELLIPEMVCDTLGMHDSRIINLTPGQLSRRAQGYFQNGTPAPYLLNNWPAYHGAGGLYSTLNDMLKYLKFMMRVSNEGMENVLDTLLRQRRVMNDSCLHPTSVDSVGLVWQFSPLYPQNPENHMKSIVKEEKHQGSTALYVSQGVLLQG